MAVVGLLVWIASFKYLDHLQLHRIEVVAARQGVPLARSALAEWIERFGVALQLRADGLVELLRERSCLDADEMPVRQLASGSGKTQHAYLWAYPSNALDDTWSCSTTRSAASGCIRAPSCGTGVGI
jgi:transposase